MTQQPKDQKPSEALTPAQVKIIAGEKFQNRMEALEENLFIRPSDQWQRLRDYWINASDDARKDIVFGLAYNNGAKPLDIQRLFNIVKKDLDQYSDVLKQAQATLKLKIQSNQIKTAFISDQPILKFFLGKQFAEQVDQPAHEGVASQDTSGGMKINVYSKGVVRDEEGNTISKSLATDDDTRTTIEIK
jgi:hypothetical protein